MCCFFRETFQQGRATSCFILFPWLPCVSASCSAKLGTWHWAQRSHARKEKRCETQARTRVKGPTHVHTTARTKQACERSGLRACHLHCTDYRLWNSIWAAWVSEWVTGGGPDAAARWQRQKPDGGRGGFTPLSCSRVCKSRHTHVQVSRRRDLKDLAEQVSDPLSSAQPGARRGGKKRETNGNLSVRRYPSRCLWFLFVVS